MASRKSAEPVNSEVPAAPGTQAVAGGNDELMTTRELMSFLNLSRTKVWEFVQYESLPAFKLGGDYRYRKSEVLAWLERFRVKSSPRTKK